MPSGATLPFVTYKDTGIQSVTSTVTSLEDENVVSSFLSMPSRTYLHGCNDVVIEGETDIGTNIKLSQLPTFQVFRIPDDGDAISKVSFVYEFDHNGTADVSKTLGFEIIKKVEVRVGNQIWQTLTGEDIFARNVTENSFESASELFESACRIQGGTLAESDLHPASNISLYTLVTGKYNISGSIDLKLFCGSGDKLNTFIQNAAPNNDIVVKIFYNELVSGVSFTNIDSTLNLKNPTLIVKKHNFTEVEKNYISKNIINSVINTSQSVAVKLDPSITNSTAFLEKTINVSKINEFTINASHLLITPLVTPYGEGASSDFSSATAHAVYSRAFGGPRNSTIKPGMHDFIKYIELFINGSSVTGKLPASYLKSNAKKFLGLNYISEFPIYCIPLASEKFGTDSLVLSKLSNKKLVITYDEAMLGGKTGNNSTVFNITAVGTNVVTYVGGECSQQIAN